VNHVFPVSFIASVYTYLQKSGLDKKINSVVNLTLGAWGAWLCTRLFSAGKQYFYCPLYFSENNILKIGRLEVELLGLIQEVEKIEQENGASGDLMSRIENWIARLQSAQLKEDMLWERVSSVKILIHRLAKKGVVSTPAIVIRCASCFRPGFSMDLMEAFRRGHSGAWPQEFMPLLSSAQKGEMSSKRWLCLAEFNILAGQDTQASLEKAWELIDQEDDPVPLCLKYAALQKDEDLRQEAAEKIKNLMDSLEEWAYHACEIVQFMKGEYGEKCPQSIKDLVQATALATLVASVETTQDTDETKVGIYTNLLFACEIMQDEEDYKNLAKEIYNKAEALIKNLSLSEKCAVATMTHELGLDWEGLKKDIYYTYDQFLTKSFEKMEDPYAHFLSALHVIELHLLETGSIIDTMPNFLKKLETSGLSSEAQFDILQQLAISIQISYQQYSDRLQKNGQADNPDQETKIHAAIREPLQKAAALLPQIKNFESKVSLTNGIAREYAFLDLSEAHALIDSVQKEIALSKAMSSALGMVAIPVVWSIMHYSQKSRS
jgi:hypothetical protein